MHSRKTDSQRLIVFQKDDYTGVCRLRIFWFVWIWPTRPPKRREPVVSLDNRAKEELYMREHPEIWTTPRLHPMKKPRRARRPK